MKKNTKIFLLFIFFLNLFLITTHPAKAGCPICILGAVSIFGVSWWLKIDQLLLGFYLGGLSIFSLIAILGWLEKKKIIFKLRGIIVASLLYFLVIITLLKLNLITLSLNQLCTTNKLLLGIILGSVILLLILGWQKFIKMVAKKITNPLIILSGLIIFLIFLLAIYWLSIKVICGS
ncbi:MAG: hypothetical protein A2Y82_00195 [Candidatus Buchananbacteria bacterium RBG_13_36_9]|uniref:Uncharacterized protein n=1 Tax=Candidatus Buchananbacteria bacterium RBG_13_36_9 TaxID=1797530 RepID=A0A1G1XMS4_9BACT|nr:MAG: hypothetical protein A2Y82_00195 [Candidatus Buchananbacteria bacterium RBG_13_36_9]